MSEMNQISEKRPPNEELTVILPAYNEEEALSPLVENWQQYRQDILADHGLNLMILIVNDGSRDRTHQIGKMLEQENANVTLVDHPHNKGLGEAVKTGLNYILDKRPLSSFAALMDSDNTHDPRFVLDMLKKQKQTGADIVIASRYETGAKIKGVSGFRLLTSQGAKLVFSLILHVPGVQDYTCGYRLYKREILQKAKKRFGDNLIKESGFTCMVELLYKLYCCGGSFAEVPFYLRYDLKAGSSKMKVVKTSLDSFTLACNLKKITREA